MGRIREFFKKETVLCVAAVCAVGTMFLVPPDGTYIGYIDLRVLCLLMCLMAVVAGFQTCGAFRWLAFQLLRRSSGGRVLGVILVMLPFFSSMLVTNDVALLTFVPFTLLLLEQIGCTSAVIPVLVLQTVAANLGSMATPVGNPQNLYLYAAYSLTAGEFFSAVLPLASVSLLGLMAAALPVLPKALPQLKLEREELQSPRKLAVYGVLFVVCLLTVFHVLHYGVMTVLVLAAIAVLEPKLLRELDVALLATFVCFFVVSGNLGRVEAVRDFLQALLGRSTLLTAVGTSQVISNVPAAVLLSGFTEQWRPLLEGVNIGGLGTPIASLASLITLKLYLRWPGTRAGRFLAVFTLANVVGLAVLLAVAMLF
ncbi:MAG: citrate transporter [Oscillibacter sp.]|nr:citrate transporter [Oscillibacter sp.]